MRPRRGSIATNDNGARLSTQNRPSPNTTSPGVCSESTRARTRPSAGSISATPGAIEREHLLGAELLAQRMHVREGVELCDQHVMAAKRELRVDPRLDGAQAQLLELLELDPRAAVELDVRQRPPPPQRFGFPQP